MGCASQEIGIAFIGRAVWPLIRDSVLRGQLYSWFLQGTVQAQAIKEPMRAADVAGAVLYLASSWSDAVTGQQVLVDRGLIKN